MHPTLYSILLLLLLTPSTHPLQSLHSFKLNDITGKEIDFSTFKGKTVLIVNVASQCGQTDAHYKSLKRLHEILSFPKDSPFEILAFPSNDFGEQEPWEEKEIEEFVRGHFKAEFLLFPKTVVKGEGVEPFWRWIAETSSTPPTWNFQKYLYSKTGEFIKTWDSSVSVESIFDVVKAAIDEPPKEQSDKIEL